MRIKIPDRFWRAYDVYEEWVNAPVWQRRHFDGDSYEYRSFIGKRRIEVRRIDVILLAAFIFCVSYYWIVSGPWGALQGGALFVLVAMVAMWML
jgi:hypothetical protein